MDNIHAVMQSRPYQERAIQCVRDEMLLGNRRVLLVIATGGGKTYTSSKIILNAVSKGKRCIFLAHRNELIEQCSRTLDALGVDHGVIKSKHPKRDLSKLVQVASVQTLIRRKHWHADLIVIDEAHRSHAATYHKIIERYDDNVALLGLTATPFRTDGKPLGEIYNALVEVISTQDLVDSGYLVEPTVFGARQEIDLSGVRVGAKGDYRTDDLATAMSSTVLQGELLTNWARICGTALGSETIFYKDEDGRDRVSQTNCDACTLIFSPDVETSIKIVDQFKAAGVRAAHLDGTAKPRDRVRTLEAFAAGEISVLGNCDLFTEGFDLPRLECIIAARPTRSKALYKQMGGRLMRPDDDKRFAFLLDHANWTRTHGFLTEPCVHSLTEPEDRPRKKKGDGSAPLKECPKCMAISALGVTICAECGYEWPRRSIEFTDEDLVILDSKTVNRAQTIPQNQRQEAFNLLAKQCVEKGYKPNWARVQYQKIYGEWPNKETGIRSPSFFWQYQRDLNKRLEQQIIAQTAADAAINS